MMRVLGAMLTCLLVSHASGQAPAASSAVPAAGWPRHVAARRRGVAGLSAAGRTMGRQRDRLPQRACLAQDRRQRDVRHARSDGDHARRQDRALGGVCRHQGDQGDAARRIGYDARSSPRCLRCMASVSLDRLQMSLAAVDAQAADGCGRQSGSARDRQHDSPAILVPIDGAAVWKPVQGSAGFSRVVNTRALILRSSGGTAGVPARVRRLADGQLARGSVAAAVPPAERAWMRSRRRSRRRARSTCSTAARRRIRSQPSRKASRRSTRAKRRPSSSCSRELRRLRRSWARHCHGRRTRPATCCATRSTYYVLLAGRWFRARVARRTVDLRSGRRAAARISRASRRHSLAGAVLAAVPGTAQARNAVVEAQIPQTATVPRSGGPAFIAKYDGAPQFVDEPGTQVARAVNASVPVIRAGNAYYAVKTGIWFTAAQPTGPWSVATSVPASIYAIPPTSPIYYVTFVRIYGVTDKARVRRLHAGLSRRLRRGRAARSCTAPATTPSRGSAMRGIPHLQRTALRRRRCSIRVSATRTRSRPASRRPRSRARAQFHPGYWGHYPCCASTSANVYRAWFKPAKQKKASPVASLRRRPRSQRRRPPSRLRLSLRSGHVRTRTPVRRCRSGTWGPSAATTCRWSPMPTPPTQDRCRRQRRRRTSPRTSITRTSPRTADGMPARRPTTRMPAATARCTASARTAGSRIRASGWAAAPSPPPAVVAQAQARANVDPGMQAGSFGMSNATRFTQAARRRLEPARRRRRRLQPHARRRRRHQRGVQQLSRRRAQQRVRHRR